MCRWAIIWCAWLGISSVAIAQESDEVYDDQYADVTYDELADRISCIQGEIPLNFNHRVQSFIDYFTVRNREYTKEIIALQDLFFPIFEEALARHGLPDELKYLSIVESGLRANAISRVGAGGLWQFMPSTGKSYGLQQSWYIDERMNPWEATEAACKYLKMLYRVFGDWELALAAYNTGPGNVRKAIRRSGYQDTFWEVYRFLPRETRSYVPQFVAIMYTLNYLDEHNFNQDLRGSNLRPEFDTLHVSGYMHLETFANQIDVCLEDMIKLNPQIIRGATTEGTMNYPIKVPVDKIDWVRKHRKEILDSAANVGKEELEKLSKDSPGSTYGRTRLVYRVRSGDVLGTIAQQYHVRISDLKKWNNLSSNMIYVGQRLNIWVLPHYSASTKVNYDGAPPKAKAEPITIEGATYHVVQSGDSLWSICQQYKDLSIEKLKKLNNLTTNRINPGQRLLINL